MKSVGKARNNGLYRHIRTSKEIIRNLLNDYNKLFVSFRNNLYLSKKINKFYNFYFLFTNPGSCAIVKGKR